MKPLSRALCVAAAWLLIGSAAQAGQGWYGSLQAGAAFLEDSSINNPTGVVTELSFDNRYVVAGALGYDWGIFRVDGELGYSEAGVEDVKSGEVGAFSFMANAYVDLSMTPRWTIYFGGGLGGANIEADVIFEDDDTVFAYQGAAGVEFEVDPTISLTVDYRYFATEDPEFDTASGGSFEAEYDRHDARVGIRISF